MRSFVAKVIICDILHLVLACNKAENPFEMRIEHFRLDTENYGLRDFYECSELHKMIGAGMYIGIKRFMEEYITDKAVNGIKCHYDMWKDVSPLWLVSHLNSRDPKLYQPMVDLVELFLSYNADVDSLATEIAFAERDHYRTSTPLCQAAKNGYIEVAHILLSRGANATLGDLQPLVTASKNLEYEVVKMLLDMGVDPDIEDVTGYTALEWAQYNQDAQIINLLLQYNATI